MKILRKKQIEELEGALNHLYAAGWNLTNDQEGRLVKEALNEVQSAMNLIFNIVDPMRKES